MLFVAKSSILFAYLNCKSIQAHYMKLISFSQQISSGDTKFVKKKKNLKNSVLGKEKRMFSKGNYNFY
jgi:hypothetical protein